MVRQCWPPILARHVLADVAVRPQLSSLTNDSAIMKWVVRSWAAVRSAHSRCDHFASAPSVLIREFVICRVLF